MGLNRIFLDKFTIGIRKFIFPSFKQVFLGFLFRCWFSSYLAWFLLSYATVASFGIAIFRFLYIKASDFVKYVVGEKIMLLIIGFGGLIVIQLYLVFNQTHWFMGSYPYIPMYMKTKSLWLSKTSLILFKIPLKLSNNIFNV